MTLPGHRTIHFCARCTGQLLGVLAYLALLIAGGVLAFSVFILSVQLFFALAPLPAAVDWLTQSLHRRQSTNGIRLATGLFLGMAWTDLLALLFLGKWLWFAGGIVVLALYVAAIAVVLKVTGGWRTVIADHFPGIET